jgi:hypothetical protein
LVIFPDGQKLTIENDQHWMVSCKKQTGSDAEN